MKTALTRLTQMHHAYVTTNAKQTVNDGPCVVGDMTVSNPNTSEVWIQFFDKLATDVTVGTTAPDLSYPCPPGDGSNSSTSVVIGSDSKLQFDTGCTYAITTTRTGSTAPALDVTVNGQWRKG
jgi:hypothetical protein